MTWLKNLYRLTLLVQDMQSANREKGKLHRRMNKMMNNEVELTKFRAQVSSRMLKKMQWYMVEMVWMSQKFAQLHDAKLDLKSQKSTAFAGALLGISDILVDDMGIDDITSVSTFLLNPSEKLAHTPLEKLYLAFFDIFEANLPSGNQSLILEYYWKTLEAQFASRQQFNPDLPQAQLINILKDKCGFTTLLCRAVVSKPLLQYEEAAVYELGGLVQFINDINDLHKDSTQGIRNFANSYTSIATIKGALTKQINLAFGCLKKLPIPRKQLDNFLFVFHSFVIITFAQLRHYEFICEGNYQLDRFLNLSYDKTKIRPYLRRNIQYSIPKILRYNFHYPFENEPIGEVY